MMLEALIFDVDGTLADTEQEGHRHAFNEAFAEAGLDWQWDRALYAELLAVTGGKERMAHYWRQYRPELGAPDRDLIARLHARKTDHFLARLQGGGLPLRPGVARLLQEARQAGLRLAIATTTTPANVETLLTSTLGVRAPGWFDVIAAGDVVPNKKPAADIYMHCLDGLKREAKRCLAFEDTHNGVQSALGAGIPVLATPTGETRDQDFGGALAVLDSLGEPGRPARRLDRPGEPGVVVTVAWLRDVHAKHLFAR